MRALPTLSPAIASFFDDYGRIDGKFELVGGDVVNGSGGTVGHAEVCGIILCALVDRLRGTRFAAFNGQMGLWIDAATVLYPDLTVYGDRRDFDLPGVAQVFRFPKIVVEVPSPVTRAADHGYKLSTYKSIDSLAAFVFVDPLDQTLEVHDRVAPNEWRHLILPPESGLTMRDPAIKLTFDEIFAVD